MPPSLGEAAPHSSLEPLVTACTAHTPAPHQPQAWPFASCPLPSVYTAPPSLSLCLTLATWLFLNTPSSFQCGVCANATSFPGTVLTCSSPGQALQSCRPHLQWPLRASYPSTHLTEARTPSQALTLLSWFVFCFVLWFFTSLIFSSSVLL